MRCFFTIQGEGRGHLTQALALQDILQTAGHDVVGAAVGRPEQGTWPDFFVDAIAGPLTPLRSVSIATDPVTHAVRPAVTAWRAMRRAFFDSRPLNTLQAALDRANPDVIINFFEPMMAMLAHKRGVSIPTVAIAHQYMFLHPGYRFPPGHWKWRTLTRWATYSTCWGADTCIALSLYPAPSTSSGWQLAQKRITVMPPLLRSRVRKQALSRTRKPYLQVYLLNESYANQLVRWHRAHPHVPLRCFWGRQGVHTPEQVDDTLTIYPLSASRFIRSMTQARGLACTAGFESIAEALYMGTPVQAVPVPGHYEQLCNAYDTVRAGAGIRSSQFTPNALLDFLPHYAPDTAAYRARVQQMPNAIVQHIERVASGR
ncbi:MAG: glycosyltransferase family protein [Longimonas sp.]|uniref:glycosyltransferase family protein n=1 Tax=Longimonas sp. TaxID=2039626 RepID=UPI00397656BB